MQFNLRIDDELNEKINKIAKKEARSKNKEIEYILQKFVDEYETKNGKIDTETEETA